MASNIPSRPCQPSPSASRLRFDFNIFATLERMYFKFAQRPEVTELCEMLTRTTLADGPGLRLTHFKIECKFGQDRAGTIELVNALSTSPLQNLVLEGLNHTTPDLLEHIGTALPNLTSLVLVHRESPRQKATRDAFWPLPGWEYGSSFAAFPKLVYFGCNMKSDSEPGPSIMLRFEEGWPDDLEWNPRYDDLEMHNDTGSWVRLFASYCPTLSTVGFISRGATSYHFIDREAQIYVQNLFELCGRDLTMSIAYSAVRDRHNPDMLHS